MVKYRWTIHTSNTLYSGTSGQVFLTLHGLNASTREVELPNPESESFDRDQTDTGIIDVAECVGEIESGTLRTEGNTTGKPWNVDWVKITNLDDGREWIASDVGECDAQGRCPILRFIKTASSGPSAGKEYQEPGDGGAQGEFASLELVQELQRQLAELKAELRALRGGMGTTPSLTTIELFGTLRGRRVPLAEIVVGGRVIPGGAVCVTRLASEGFGLGGTPGKWPELYPDSDPEKYGLDPLRPVLAFDGQKVWPLSARFLEMLLGASWRDELYGQ